MHSPAGIFPRLAPSHPRDKGRGRRIPTRDLSLYCARAQPPPPGEGPHAHATAGEGCGAPEVGEAARTGWTSSYPGKLGQFPSAPASSLGLAVARDERESFPFRPGVPVRRPLGAPSNLGLQLPFPSIPRSPRPQLTSPPGPRWLGPLPLTLGTQEFEAQACFASVLGSGLPPPSDQGSRPEGPSCRTSPPPGWTLESIRAPPFVAAVSVQCP